MNYLDRDEIEKSISECFEDYYKAELCNADGTPNVEKLISIVKEYLSKMFIAEIMNREVERMIKDKLINDNEVVEH